MKILLVDDEERAVRGVSRWIAGDERNFKHAKLSVHEVVQGMVLAEDIRNQTGTLLMSKGHRLSGSAIRLLENYYKKKILSGPLKVIVRSEPDEAENAPPTTAGQTPEIPLPHVDVTFAEG